MINSKQTLVGTLNNAVEYIQPVTQEKIVTPSQEQQIVEPDKDYTGLSKVTVDPIPSEYTKVDGTLDITNNGEYDVKNYEKANVNIGGFEINDAYYLCYGNSRNNIIEELGDCITPDCTRYQYCFGMSDALTEIPSNWTFDSAENMSFVCTNCSKLVTIGKWYLGNVNNIQYAFRSTKLLQNIGGFVDLGKAYLPTMNASYAAYKLDLSANADITYESLMNVISNLYDLTSIGVKAQDLVFPTECQELLSEDEILIGTNKGWNILFA